MIGIENIGSYIPEHRISNYQRKQLFSITDDFIENKIGIKSVARKNADEDTSDLCVKAFHQLHDKCSLQKDEIEVLVVVTQNPDTNIPHTSAMVHGKLELPTNCACFDISLGCSGYVYALSVVKSFMQENNLKKGLLFTADPYSKIIDPQDKNTTLLFGDAASVTLLSPTPVFRLEKFSFGTAGRDFNKLICNDGILHMNGRGVFNFAAKHIPDDVHALVSKNGISLDEVDKFLLHQGSRIIVETIRKNLAIPHHKVPYAIHDYGNTVSSSIPLLLEAELCGSAATIAIAGFGVGLSWASGIIRRVE